MRLITGFCFAGIFVIVESWLNERSNNESRGMVLSIYLFISLGGLAGGQWLFNLANQIVSIAVKDSYSHTRQQEAENNSDSVICYGKIVLELGLAFLNLSDIIKSPSRVRMLCLLK